MQFFKGIVIGIALLLPSLVVASEAAPSEDETPVNQALVAAIAAMEGATPGSNALCLDNLALRVAGLEAEGPWHGSLTYRTQYVSGGRFDGFDHGVQLGLSYHDFVAPDLMLKFDMLMDSDSDLFNHRFDSDSGRMSLDRAYFKYSR